MYGLSNYTELVVRILSYIALYLNLVGLVVCTKSLKL